MKEVPVLEILIRSSINRVAEIVLVKPYRVGGYRS